MSSERRPRRPWPWGPVRDREPQADDADQAGMMDPETQVDEGVVAGAAMDRQWLQIEHEIERLRQIEGEFEEKYHASLDEFQARYTPGDDPQLDADYLEWAHVAEQLRQLRANLKRPTRRRGRAPGGEERSEV